MSLYTIRGSEKLDAQIDTDLQRIAEAASPFASAGVLLGGYGRGEGTPFIHLDGSQGPFNDYDLVVIVNKLNEAVRQRFLALEIKLTKEIGLPVDLCPYLKSDLPTREFSLLNYEMKHGHKVVWGNAEILAAMPDYPHDAIPLSEGARLLMNRGKLLLDIKQRLVQPAPLADEERTCFIKFIHKALLAFGDCALLGEGKYDLSYAVKKERISSLQNIPDRNFVINGYLKAIELKEWGDFQALADFDVDAEFALVREVFLRFFPWYQTQYSGKECSRLKAMALNLKWNKSLNAAHPRTRLYTAVCDLLQDKSTLPIKRFYDLQRRFS
jgi:hypothetical protein